ncbi:TlpA disulfide reductase family protein [Virgibacillus halophilus]|uniref:TlpA disulfide reductase family protein n=1 Tax=Tigheibacillus halophilus TaxID=361280 RepID=A0ABU5C8Y6_9BACI|nr:TlpA disulfide reductase family protein [Virgibacillus halophilus]
MLNFWATWCPPCRSEIPDLEKFHQESDVTVLGVDSLSQERNVTAVSEFIKEFDMTYPVLKDKDGLIIGLYQVQSYPTTYLIDSKGRISNIAVGPLNYEQMVQAFETME